MVPKYNAMYASVLRLLQDGKEHYVKDIRDYVASEMHVTEADRKETLKSGDLKYNNYLGWALTYLKKGEMVETPSRGMHKLTPKGKAALKERTPETIDNDFLKQSPNFMAFWVGNTETDKPIVQTQSKDEIEEAPTERMEEAFRQINDALAGELIEEIIKQDPWFFESLVVKLLVKMGYGGSNPEAGVVTQKSGDEGIDGIIKEDKLGLSKIYIQAKRWNPNQTIGRPDIQTFVGALMGHGVSKGVYITTAHFAASAKEYAAKQHSASIVLIDGQELARLMIEFNLGVASETVYEIKRVDSDFFNFEI